MKQVVPTVAVAMVLAWSVSVGAQWPKYPMANVPRDSQGNVLMDAPPPRTADGHVDFSGLWVRAESGPPRAARAGGRGAPAAQAGRAAGPGRQDGGTPAPTGRPGSPGQGVGSGGPGGVQLEPPTPRFPYDPNAPPVATFFEAGGNMAGGLPYTPWAKQLRDERHAADNKDNPDANCLPMGFLQFHLQPQPRKIIQTPGLVVIEYEANYGLRHIYTDGRALPPQGDPTPWWYGYSVGHWDGDTLVVETNNLRGAEDGPHDGWLDVNGSPYTEQAKFTERFRRLTTGHLQMDITVEDAKAYTKPWTVRIDQRLLPDQELIEFICNENQQFTKHVKVD